MIAISGEIADRHLKASGMRVLIRRSIIVRIHRHGRALLKVPRQGSASPSRAPRHIGRKPGLEGLAQLCHQMGRSSFGVNASPPVVPMRQTGTAKRRGTRDRRFRRRGRGGHHIVALLLAGAERMGGQRRGRELGSDAGSHRHLRRARPGGRRRRRHARRWRSPSPISTRTKSPWRRSATRSTGAPPPRVRRCRAGRATARASRSPRPPAGLLRRQP